MLRAVIGGAVMALIFVFPAALLCGLLFRFPVPFAGYQSGPVSMVSILAAVAFYGLLGGFPVMLIGGALAGAIAYGMHPHDERPRLRLTAVLAASVALAGVALLATLDKFIGPW